MTNIHKLNLQTMVIQNHVAAKKMQKCEESTLALIQNRFIFMVGGFYNKQTPTGAKFIKYSKDIEIFDTVSDKFLPTNYFGKL